MNLQARTTGAGLQLPDLSGIDWAEVFRAESVLRDALQAGLVLALALIGYRGIVLLSRRLERDIEEADPLVKRMREQRARTLASLLRNVGLVVIVVVAGLTILGLFINIGPLLATAGIVGLAISFGAQSLVKDVISGAFILIEGQFGIGDVVRVADGTAGMVEKITLRTTVLRDLHGVVHVIPNGEITRLSNLTKAWSRAVLDIGVAYGEDVDRVIAVLRDVGRQLHQDPDWGPLLIDEPEVLGVEALADSAVTIRLTTKTLPLKQWDVARELRRRIKNRFDAEGIEIPFPHRTVYWGKGQMPGPNNAAPAAGPDQERIP